MASHYVDLDGEKVSVSEYCRRKGISYYAVAHRHKKLHESYEESIAYYENTENKGFREKYTIEYDGKLISVKEYCEILGISYSALMSRKSTLGLSLEEVISQYENGEVKEWQHFLDIDGKKISVSEYCKRNGLSISAVYTRKNRKNETFEEAIAFFESGNTGKPKVNIDGELVSITEACKRKNLSYSAVTSYKYNNDSITWEEAIDYIENRVIEYKIKDIRLYNIWRGMMDRCYNPKNSAYENYGGRGITVCDEWHDCINFQNDLYDSYIKHCEEFGIKDTTFDRWPNTNGNYEPNNTRWATRKEQNRNKRNTIYLSTGESLRDYCDRTGISFDTIRWRMHYKGLTADEAIAIPIRHYKSRK